LRGVPEMDELVLAAAATTTGFVCTSGTSVGTAARLRRHCWDLVCGLSDA